MLLTNSDVYMGSYRVFQKNNANLVDLGIIQDDGITVTEVITNKEITNQDKSTYDEYLFLQHITVSFKLKTINPENVAMAFKNSELEVSGSNKKLTVKAGRTSLYQNAKTYVLKPLHDEDNENLWITLHKAANSEAFSVTFKEDEETVIPITLKCFKDRATGEIITIGDTTVSV